MKLLHTIELEPRPDGTTVHFRYAPPKTKREQVLMGGLGNAYGEALEASFPSLVAQLDEVLAASEAGVGPEPELAKPRPDGPLSGLAPLQMVD